MKNIPFLLFCFISLHCKSPAPLPLNTPADYVRATKWNDFSFGTIQAYPTTVHPKEFICLHGQLIRNNPNIPYMSGDYGMFIQVKKRYSLRWFNIFDVYNSIYGDLSYTSHSRAKPSWYFNHPCSVVNDTSVFAIGLTHQSLIFDRRKDWGEVAKAGYYDFRITYFFKRLESSTRLKEGLKRAKIISEKVRVKIDPLKEKEIYGDELLLERYFTSLYLTGFSARRDASELTLDRYKNELQRATIVKQYRNFLEKFPNSYPADWIKMNIYHLDTYAMDTSKMFIMPDPQLPITGSFIRDAIDPTGELQTAVTDSTFIHHPFLQARYLYLKGLREEYKMK